MRFPRVPRLAAACRPLVVALSFTFAATVSAQTTADLTGTILDQEGRPIPRVYIRAIDARGAEIARAFGDEAGRFAFRVAEPASCRLEVSLSGFRTSTAPCASGSQRIVLAVAPVGEAVLVTATRTDAPLSQVGASATVFTADDLTRRQIPLVVDLLQHSPGTMVIRNGGSGALTSLFVRGGESDYNKVLLDGVPLNEPGGNFYFNNLTTENLERVEIVRGAYSSLFGSDAMASVIQLFTARPDGTRKRPKVTGQFDGGTYDTMHMNAAVSGTSGRVAYSLGAARLSSDNRVPNSRLENSTLSTNIAVAVGPRATLRFVTRAELAETGTPGMTAFGRPDLDAAFKKDDLIGALSFEQQFAPAIRHRLAYSLASSKQHSTNLLLDPPYTASFAGHTAQFGSSDFAFDIANDLRRHHVSYQLDWRLTRGTAKGEHLLTLLADWDGERATLESRLSGSRIAPSRNNSGISAEHQVLWPRVFLTLGGRIEQNESFGTEAVPRAAVAFVARQGTGSLGETRLKASFGLGIKEPTMAESYGVSFFALGNPDLKPERSRSAEIGVEQRFGNDRAKLGVAYFDNEFKDLIWTETTDFTTFAGQYFNLVGLSRSRGLEIGFDAAPVTALRARFGYTFLASEIVESLAQAAQFQEGAWAFRRPRHSGYAGVTIEWRRLTADVSGLFLGRFVDNDFGLFDPPIVEISAHTTWDARFSVKLTGQTTAMVAVDNVTDRDYMQPIGYEALGRVVRAGIRVGF